MIKYFLYLLFKSPIFAITEDNNFDKVKMNPTLNFLSFRYSLIRFGFGDRKIYILSFTMSDSSNNNNSNNSFIHSLNFDFYKVIYLKNIQIIDDVNTINNKVEQYKTYLINQSIEQVNAEIDFLKYRIAEEENIKNTSVNKVNFFITALSIAVPLIIDKIFNNISSANSLIKIFQIISLYFLINVLAFIWNFYKVKAIYRSSFSDLKFNNNSNNSVFNDIQPINNISSYKLAIQYYLDWYVIKQEAPLFVSYVKNIELYLLKSLVTLIITFSLSYFNYYKIENNKKESVINNTSSLIVSNSSFKADKK